MTAARAWVRRIGWTTHLDGSRTPLWRWRCSACPWGGFSWTWALTLDLAHMHLHDSHGVGARP